MDILDILPQSINPDNNFINSVYNLRSKINMQTNLFSQNKEVSPNLIFFYILKIIDDEFKNEKIPYNNNVFKDLKTIEKIPQSSHPLILGKNKEFEELGSPCYNNFYYLILDAIKCPKCNSILAVKDNTILGSHFLPLPGGFDENVTNLIKYYMNEECENTNQNYICKCGIYKGYGKAEKAFLNTPKYLFMDFEGQSKKRKHLDEKLDLTEYKLTDRGPNQYYLYAFITKKFENYIAYVKKGSSWISYSDETIAMSVPNISFEYVPYYAIYKGME